MINTIKALRTSTKTLLAALGLLSISSVSYATTVQIQTVLGDFEVNLYDKKTPETVKNFLSYVNSGAYKDTVIHRSDSSFVIQGGGFKYTGTPSVTVPLAPITTRAPVINEATLSNVRGTIAMAKLGNNPNSATSQWFINLKDNSGGGPSLDTVNAGYTVFGQVTGNGMAIVEAIAALKNYNGPGTNVPPFNELPLRNYSSGPLLIDDKDLVMVTGIVVLNPSPDTADALNPPPSKRLNNGGNNGGGNNGGGKSSGGSTGTLLIAGLLLLVTARRFRFTR